MPRHKNYLSPFEWEVMSAVWELPEPITVKHVIEKSYPNGEKAYTTVQTIMNILVEKGFLAKDKFGPVNIYKPLKKRSEAVTKETNIFINKVFDGSFQNMASFMIGSRKLSKTEIEYLKQLIEKQENKGGGE